MREQIQISSLGTANTQQVARLERELHPQSRWGREGRQSLFGHLRNAEKSRANLSLGLFAGAELVGYLIAYVAEASRFSDSEAGEVIYLHDLAILPRHRAAFKRLVLESDRIFNRLASGLPVEAYVLEPDVEDWTTSASLFARAGFRFAFSRPVGWQVHATEVFGLRWDPAGEADRSAPPTAQPGPTDTYEIQGRQLSVELVSTVNRWRSLQEDWDRLLAAVPEHTIFQTFEFQWTWWWFFGLSRQLFVLVVRDGQEIVGFAPLEIKPSEVYRGRFRELCFIGTPHEVDRAKLILPPGVTPYLQAVVACLLEHRDEWDTCQLWEQSPDDPAVQYIRDELIRGGYLIGCTETSPNPWLDLDTTWEDYLGTRSKRLRKNLRQSRRRLESTGELRFEEYRRWPETREKMKDYRAVEQRSWKPAKGLGISCDLQHFCFYESIADQFSQRGRFDLRFLTLDAKPIAATFGLRHGQMYHSMRITHDQAYDRFSPGTLLESRELESLFASELERYDFLGGFLSNKLRWTDQVTETVNVHIFKPIWRLRLLHFVFFRVKPRVKDALRRVGLFDVVIRLIKRFEGSRIR